MQISLANEQLNDIDDRIFVKQREYNIALSTYKYKDEQSK